MTDLLDKVGEKGGELVPFRGEPGSGGESGPGSPIDRLLGRFVPPPDDDFNRMTLYAALGSAIALVGAVLLAALPSGDSIRGEGFYVVGQTTLANFMDYASSAATPLAIFAAALFVVTGLVWITGRRDGFGQAVCVIQPAIGVATLGGSGLVWGVLLAVIALNLVIWIVVIVAVTAIAIGMLIGFVTGALEG